MSGRQRNLRKRRALDELEEASEDEAAPTVEDTKLLQKQRERRKGMEATALAVPDKKAGVRSAGGAAGAATDDMGLRAFNKEKARATGDEDPHMKKYVEEQLAKRLGRPVGGDEGAGPSGAAAADPHLEGIKTRTVDTELGPSWVAGIVEVPLAVEQRLKQIEATEVAKKKLLEASGVLGPRGFDDDDGPQGQAARRAHYPVTFGKQDPKQLEIIAMAQARKQLQRERLEEKKAKKKAQYAPGW